MMSLSLLAGSSVVCAIEISYQPKYHPNTLNYQYFDSEKLKVNVYSLIERTVKNGNSKRVNNK